MISWSSADIAGVEFGDDRLMVARLAGKGDGHLTLTHAGWISYNHSASARDVAAAIRTLWKESSLSTRTVCASLRSASLVMRYFKYPLMPDPELKSALELQAEEALQMSREHIVVDWHRMGISGKDGESGHVHGVLFAAPVKDVERQLEALFMAGLDPVVMDIRAMAVANLYFEIAGQRMKGPLCLVNVCPHSADVIVLPAAEGSVYPHTVLCRASTWEAAPAFLGDNVRDVLRYCEFKLDWEHVPKIVLTGSVPATPGFVNAVSAGAKLPVEVWDPLAAVRVRGGVEKRISELSGVGASLACSMGLGLRRG